METVIRTILTSLVDSPEKMEVNVMEGEKVVAIEIKVADSDRGKAIGKRGKIVSAIRTIVEAIGARNKKRVTLHL